MRPHEATWFFSNIPPILEQHFIEDFWVAKTPFAEKGFIEMTEESFHRGFPSAA